MKKHKMMTNRTVKNSFIYLILMLNLSIISCDDELIPEHEQFQRDVNDIVEFLKTSKIADIEDGEFEDTKDESESLFKDAIKDPSGVYYIIRNDGQGKKISEYTKKSEDYKILMHYELFFLSSLKIKSSYYQHPHGSKFPFKDMIEGLKKVIPILKTGIKNPDGTFKNCGKAIVLIPSRLAYGIYGSYHLGIPANTPIIWTVKVLDIEKN